MKSNSFKYLIKTGIHNLWSNRVMAFASIGVLMTCLLLVGAAFVFTQNVNSIVGYVESQTEMNVYMTEKATDDQIASVEKSIKSNGKIASCNFISKEQGLENFKDTMGEEGYLLDSIKDRNTIPDTFVVKIKNIADTKAVRAELKALDGVDDVAAAIEVADTFMYIQRAVTIIGTIVVIVLAIISLVIISNTIRATIFARRKEINIMKFVGATNSFIRIPFIVEGFMLGIISAVVAYLGIWGCYSAILASLGDVGNSWLNQALQSIIPFKSIALPLAGFFLLSGTLLGTLGSIISIKNHVKV